MSLRTRQGRQSKTAHFPIDNHIRRDSERSFGAFHFRFVSDSERKITKTNNIINIGVITGSENVIILWHKLSTLGLMLFLPPRILGATKSLDNTVHGFTFCNRNGIIDAPINILPWADNQQLFIKAEIHAML